MTRGSPRVTAAITCMTDAEEPYLGRALVSVLAQARPVDVVVYVQDDNLWIDDLLGGLPSDEVCLVRRPLAPPGVVRNGAVEMATTEFVAFLDGDDEWTPTKVETQLALLDRHALDVMASKHVLVRDDGTPFFHAFARDVPMTSSWMGRTDVLGARAFGSAMLGEDVEGCGRADPLRHRPPVPSALPRAAGLPERHEPQHAAQESLRGAVTHTRPASDPSHGFLGRQRGCGASAERDADHVVRVR